MKKILTTLVFAALNLTVIFDLEASSLIKTIRMEKDKIYHCDGKSSKKALDYTSENFKCELMRKDKYRQAPFEYITTKKTVNLFCPKKLALSSSPQYDEGYIYKYLVACKKP
jgi:hypothetical protein